jgi:succinate dehydrogenase / fumarate reductase flavoprotein subunit
VPRDPREQRRGRDVPEKERDYFLESKYPGYGNLVPRDIASRELFLKCFHDNRGVYNPKSGKNELEVYLDVTHLPKDLLQKKLAGVLEIYDKFVGEDPYDNPMRIFPAVHYSMGGLWVDFEKSSDGKLVVGSPRNHATNIEGLYAAGEVDYQYHGANRLGANSLLSCIYGGMVAGPAIASYVKNLATSSYDLKGSVFERAAQRERDRYQELLAMQGKENPYLLHDELAQVMLRDCTIERHNGVLDKVIAKVDELEDRWHDVGVTDTGARANQGAQFVRHLRNMLVLARVIAQGARNRDESRGAHFKPEFKQRDDASWLRTTMALHRQDGKRSAVDYVRSVEYSLHGKTLRVTDDVDVSLVKPRARRYETAGAASATASSEASPRSQSPKGATTPAE